MIGEVPKAFDTIAPAYDSTRDPLDATTIEGVAQLLRTEGIHAILEIGVGTGRVARPLSGLGFQMTGVDASRGMLALARAKGLPRLVRGSAYHLPFSDRAFDAALMVHVLHLLEEPRTALREATRAARWGAWALVHPPGGKEPHAPSENEPRRIVFRLLAQQGYPVPARGSGPPEKERSILRQFPPDSLAVVSDRMVTEPLAKRLDMIAQGASRHTMNVPKDVLRDAVEVARSEVGDRTFTYRRVEALARWSAATVAAFPAAPTPP
ncbi:MAG TPA: class I SAM-dependent methyltransferase [Thermoplasmata archaeon]|nr:class I SAM-dependent methyltransferase [Thermoplasmata archaeon]